MLHYSASLLEADELSPSIVFVAEHLVSAPIHRVYLRVFRLRQSRDGEWEAIDRHLHASLLSDSCIRVQSQALIEVLSTEATHNQDRILVKLSCSQALTILDSLRRIELIFDGELLPERIQITQVLFDVYPLDGAYVSF